MRCHDRQPYVVFGQETRAEDSIILDVKASGGFEVAGIGGLGHVLRRCLQNDRLLLVVELSWSSGSTGSLAVRHIVLLVVYVRHDTGGTWGVGVKVRRSEGFEA